MEAGIFRIPCRSLKKISAKEGKNYGYKTY